MKRILLILLVPIFFVPSIVFGVSKFSYGVWIPYWKRTGAVPEVTANINKVKTISPFSYEVQKNGKIWDAMKLKEFGWLQLFELTGSEKKNIIPTISWQNGTEIHTHISSSTLRAEHIKNILALVDQNDFDGVDIDYENKLSDTRTSFTKFLTELKKELAKRKKKLSCTIEARTPTASRFVVVPKDLEYANDFVQIGKVCDEVRIMAYGQGGIDLLLNKKKRANGSFYMPISDTEWVQKVIQETLKSIKKEKVVLGVANFGYEYAISSSTTSTQIQYQRLRSVTYKDVQNIIASSGVKSARGNSGELNLVYSTSTSATASSTLRFVSFSDSNAISEKVKLAKKFGLGGVMIFRVDGEGDPNMWSVLK